MPIMLLKRYHVSLFAKTTQRDHFWCELLFLYKKIVSSKSDDQRAVLEHKSLHPKSTLKMACVGLLVHQFVEKIK